jgi:hypothetical protein
MIPPGTEQKTIYGVLLSYWGSVEVESPVAVLSISVIMKIGGRRTRRIFERYAIVSQPTSPGPCEG